MKKNKAPKTSKKPADKERLSRFVGRPGDFSFVDPNAPKHPMAAEDDAWGEYFAKHPEARKPKGR